MGVGSLGGGVTIAGVKLRLTAGSSRHQPEEFVVPDPAKHEVDGDDADYLDGKIPSGALHRRESIS